MMGNKAECWAIKTTRIKQMQKTETKTIRMMLGKTHGQQRVKRMNRSYNY